MTIFYKLTDKDGYTRRHQYGQTHWSVGSIVSPTGTYRGIPCSSGCLHFYASETEASLYYPIHVGRGTDLLFAVRKKSNTMPVETDGLKWWTPSSVLVLGHASMPQITDEERVAWAICLCPHKDITDWAISWLNGADRSINDCQKSFIDIVDGIHYVNHGPFIEDHHLVLLAAAAESLRLRAYVPPQALIGGLSPGYYAAWCAERVSERTPASDFAVRSLSALDRARRILAGKLSAEKYGGNT